METTSPIKVSSYKLFAANGRYIRQATQVEFPNGQRVRFMEKLGKRNAIKQARFHL